MKSQDKAAPGDSTPSDSGFRRRILIEPSATAVRAELEDDYHRMVVTLTIADGIITAVDSQMKRSPWNLCPGAIGQLAATFRGKRLDDAAVRDEKNLNCTHLFDLASFAAAHAGAAGPVAYEVEVSDPVAGEFGRETTGRIWRSGELLYDLLLRGKAFAGPAGLEGRGLYHMGDWIAEETEDRREAAKILRWAMIMSQGRQYSFDETAPPESFARAVCFNFQPHMAEIGRRRPESHVDFTGLGVKPMADREAMFTRHD